MPVTVYLQNSGPKNTIGPGRPQGFGPSRGAQTAYYQELNLSLTGITRDYIGAVLASCVVLLFQTADNVFVGQTASDGSGNYSFTMSRGQGPFYAVAYKTGAPDVAGSTVNTLQGA